MRQCFFLILTFVLVGALVSTEALAASRLNRAPANEAVLRESLKKDPTNVKIREKLAGKLVKKEKWDEIIKLLAPYSGELKTATLMHLASAYRFKQDYLGEIRALEVVAGKTPKNYLPHFLLGRAYENYNDLDKAIGSYRKAVAANEKHKPSHLALLSIFTEKEKKKNNYEARIIVGDLIRIFGHQPEFYSYQCRLFADDGFLDEAIKACHIAMRTDPKKESNHIDLAQAFIDKGKVEDAKKTLVKAAKKFKKSEWINWSAGQFFLGQKNYQVAYRYFKRAVKNDRRQSRSRLGLAQAHFELSQYDKSLAQFVAACKLDKTHRNDFRRASARLDKMKLSSEASKFYSKQYHCN